MDGLGSKSLHGYCTAKVGRAFEKGNAKEQIEDLIKDLIQLFSMMSKKNEELNSHNAELKDTVHDLKSEKNKIKTHSQHLMRAYKEKLFKSSDREILEVVFDEIKNNDFDLHKAFSKLIHKVS